MKLCLPILAALLVAACGKADGPPVGPEPAMPRSPSATPSGAPIDARRAPQPHRDPACETRAGVKRPAIISHQALHDSPGRAASQVADVVALPAPVRVCGLSGAAQFLANLHCADGSRPINSAAAADAAHLGEAPNEVGPCDTPIDLYELRCPSGGQKVKLDLYWCVEDAHFDRSPYSDY